MKQKLLIAVVVRAGLCGIVFLERERIAERIMVAAAAKARTANELPEDALRAIISDSSLVLFSLSPHREAVNPPDRQAFQNYPVLGQTTVADEARRRQMADELQRGLENWSGREMAACFNPRHGIRATDGGRTFELLICFECGRIYYFPPPGERKRNFEIRMKPGVFDDILIAENIPRPPPPRSP